jgi:hypothetical protein
MVMHEERELSLLLSHVIASALCEAILSQQGIASAGVSIPSYSTTSLAMTFYGMFVAKYTLSLIARYST